MNGIDAINESLLPRIEAALDRFSNLGPGCPARLKEAMRYSLLAPGKRLRPMLVLLAAEACGGAIEPALPAACAVEMIHAYSLVHDDLPAMDDDDLRRGRPTCHKAFDEATAILAGDALLTLAFETVARHIEPPSTAAACCAALAEAAGACQLVGGQADDMEQERKAEGGRGKAKDCKLDISNCKSQIEQSDTLETNDQPSTTNDDSSAGTPRLADLPPSPFPLPPSAKTLAVDSRLNDTPPSNSTIPPYNETSFDLLTSIHRRKTGAMIRVSLRLGGMVAGASLPQLESLECYGNNIGLAFQVIDDLLDVRSSEEIMGKRTGKDAQRGKLTFPGLIGFEESGQYAARLVKDACESLAGFGPRATGLEVLARYVLERNR
jgi:geranylgeranyl diphosphate synthase, type II